MPETPQTALVADDDVSIRLMLTRVLEREGFRVDAAKDGLEALDQFSKHHFDVVFLDLMMPRLDGLGVLRYLRTHNPEALKSVIVMTAFHNVASEVYEGEPVATVMEKPFDIAALIESAVEVARENHPSEQPPADH